MADSTSFTVLDMPREERPRERLLRLGPEALSSPELLALIIGRGVSKRSVMAIAQELYLTFRSVKAINEATIEELSKIKGIGPAKAIQMQLSKECQIHI